MWKKSPDIQENSPENRFISDFDWAKETPQTDNADLEKVLNTLFGTTKIEELINSDDK
jgi:hypothetical protein